MLKQLLSASLLFSAPSVDELHERKIEQLKREYEKTSNMPRKMKKAKRKALNQDYQFFMALKEWM